MEINSKKSLKILALVITSLLISFASAETYSELFMNAAPITIGSAGVYFVAGTNTTAMGGINAINTAGTVVTFNAITIEPGETKTYAQAVNITNNAGAAKTLNMSLDSLAGMFSTNFEYINITIVASNGTALGQTIKILPSPGTNITSTGNINIANSATYTIKWVIKAQTTATTGQSINVTLRVKVS
jgi:hypothetical protein